MSRLGKLPIQIPAGTEVNIDQELFELRDLRAIRALLTRWLRLKTEEGLVVTVGKPEDKKERALGAYFELIANMVTGVVVMKIRS